MQYGILKCHGRSTFTYIDTTLLHTHIHHPLGTFSEVIVMHLLLTEYDATEVTTQFVKTMTNFLQCACLCQIISGSKRFVRVFDTEQKRVGLKPCF